MTGFPGSPPVLKGGIVLADPTTLALRRVIALQYNPDTLTRTLQPSNAGRDRPDHAEALRLTGPPVETIKLDAEIDATDQLEQPGGFPGVTEAGIFPALSALETILYPTSAQLQANDALASAGTLEIVPMETALVLFVWSRTRVVPVRLTEFTVTEEAFDVALNPIRARVSLGMRVLSVADLGFAHQGGGVFMTYLRQKERLAGLLPSAALSTLGLTGLR
ncbi:hypothetical protein G7085_06950 [Tessaracoccus sp. HDW20]|uniref:hypothetical protein n=1 Tax=Tessaracoccus coleopterorum TaxID=2714950 RepID=UPI0018D2B2E9|nr:hypothetical protein [Tessaracoccus coleopterorum]NHB84431.1 hypothetical protein [Tessaracoccus coleopterorum]